MIMMAASNFVSARLKTNVNTGAMKANAHGPKAIPNNKPTRNIVNDLVPSILILETNDTEPSGMTSSNRIPPMHMAMPKTRLA